MSKDIFRKVALERLSSPDQLDLAMKVTTPKGWAALSGLIIILGFVVLWGIFGSLPTKVSGTAILIKSGGVLGIYSASGGRVTDISIKPGDMIRKGQVVGRIEQLEILSEINDNEMRLQEFIEQKTSMDALSKKETEIKIGLRQERKGKVRQQIAALKKRSKWLDEKISSQEQLIEKGLITKQNLLDTKQMKFSLEKEIMTLKSELTEISVRKIGEKKRSFGEKATMAQKISGLERTLKNLYERLNQHSKIIAPYTGRVLEVKIVEGDLIGTGEFFITMEKTGKTVKDLEAVIYLSAMDGKKVKPGMDIEITPSIVKKEEYGSMLGKVVTVSEFPVSSGGIMRVLRNRQLVEQIIKNHGTPIEIYGDLIPNPDSHGGYRWTSPKGSQIKIQSGTLGNVSIVVRRQAPITLVIPYIKEKLGI